jgi:hypothetical protein
VPLEPADPQSERDHPEPAEQRENADQPRPRLVPVEPRPQRADHGHDRADGEQSDHRRPRLPLRGRSAAVEL